MRSPALSNGASGRERSSAHPALSHGMSGGEDSSAQPSPLTWGERGGDQQCAAPLSHMGRAGERPAVRSLTLSQYKQRIVAFFIEQCRAQWSKPFLPNFSN